MSKKQRKRLTLAWSIAIGTIVVLSFILVMTWMTDKQGVRFGTWAQFLGSVGTAAAAIAAWRTAVTNREQARETNKALAHSTRPQLSVNMMPIPAKAGTGHGVSTYRIFINNYSPFDVPRGVAYWTLRDKTKGQVRFGALPGKPYDEPPPGGVLVTVTGKEHERRSHLVLELGDHVNFEKGEDTLTLHYVSPFGDGGWIERHVWRTENKGTEDEPQWESNRFIDSATWASLAEMDIRPEDRS